MEHLIPLSGEASRTELRLFLRRLAMRAGDAGLTEDEVDRIVVFGGCGRPATLERRARRLERMLSVAASLLGCSDATAAWLRLPNPGLAGQSPFEALVGHEDALRSICAALVDEHRASFPEGGW